MAYSLSKGLMVTMKRQDGHLQFDPKRNNLRSYAHGGGSLQEWMENKRSVDFHGFGSGDAGGPIDSRVDDLCNHGAHSLIVYLTLSKL
jgi:hypothetical protein